MDDLLEKASSLDIDNIIEKIGEHSRPFMQVFSVAQNYLDNPKMKKLVETMLIKLTAKIEEDQLRMHSKPKDLYQLYKLVFDNLTPEFQDFLIEMDENKKIKLNEIRFHAEEEIYAKFDNDPLKCLSYDSGDKVCHEIYT